MAPPSPKLAGLRGRPTVMDYIYRIIRASWGIVVTVSGEFVEVERAPGFTAINSKLGVLNKCETLTAKEIEFLYLGARLVGKEVEEVLRDRPPLVLVVNKVDYPYCDYQEEGVAAAVAGLIARKFSLSEPDLGVHFDKSLNRYVFNFDNVA